MPTDMHITLPEPLRAYVEQRVSEGGYGSVSDYVRELIRLDVKRTADRRLEGMLLEGVDSDSEQVDAAYLESLREWLTQRIDAKRGSDR
mgnify:CR=1 FL=1